MEITKYNPKRELRKMEKDIEKFWDNGWGFPALATEALAVDMYEENNMLTVELGIPNFKKNEISVETDNNVLEVSAEHTEHDEDKSKRRYLLRESSSRYFRRIHLPDGTDSSNIDAHFVDGKLKMTMPFAPKSPRRSVSVK